MRILLDTHVLLWALAVPGKLSAIHADAISDPTNHLFASAINMAEIAIKSSIGKLKVDRELENANYARFRQAVEETGFEWLAFSAAHAALLRTLPLYHRDPFDRMIIAQAIHEEMVILTVDEQFSLYQVELVAG